MVMSMTGYGRNVLSLDNTTITVEIRSVNHRYLDVASKVPRTFIFLEDKIKKMIHTYFHRGRVEVYISVEGEGFIHKTLKTDWDLMDQYMQQVGKAKERYKLSGDIPATIITTIPDLITIQELQNQPDEWKDSILNSMEKACEEVRTMREAEGHFLLHDINKRMELIHHTVSCLQTLRSSAVESYKERIRKRMEEHLDETIIVDEARIHQEIVLLIEKGDITEEIVRLFSHIEHFNDTLGETGPIGRKLDFITQELHREANTIGSKSTDAEISEYTVALKSEIEKIKEQVQNIE
ncbi:YicC/YloC family endoribonuclease [Virgibacillus ainsalahensis]